MWVVYSLLALLGLLLLLLLVPVYARVAYDGTLTAGIRVLGIPIRLLPLPPEQEKPSGEEKKPPKKKKKSAKRQELVALLRQDDLAATLHFLRRLAEWAGRTAGKVLRSITVTRLELQLLVATEDPADTATLYGKVCGALYPALAGIERGVRIRHRAIRVEPNFLLEKSDVRFVVRLRLSVIRLLGAAICALVAFLLIKEDTSEGNKEVV